MEGFVAGVSVFCFAASYAVSLGLELTRLWFRSGFRGAVMTGFTAAGLFAHTLFLGYRASQELTPLSSPFEWYLISAWLLAASYLTLSLAYPSALVGVFMLPLVLGLIGLAELADTTPYAPEPAMQMWGLLHGAFMMLGTVGAATALSAGLMYLVQANRLKRRLPAWRGVRLPSLESLERIASRGIAGALVMVGLGLTSGVVLNMVGAATTGRPLAWTDPVIIISVLMFACMLAASLMQFVYPPADKGRKVAYLTISTFLFLLVALASNLLVPTGHRGPPGPSPQAGTGDAVRVSDAAADGVVGTPRASSAIEGVPLKSAGGE